jgi:hypothetical protein
MQKVSLYVRHNCSRKYEKVSAKASFGKGSFPPGTIFVLRYVREGKRCFETLKDCTDLKTAHERWLTREIDLLRGTVVVPAPRPAPTPKPVTPAPTAILCFVGSEPSTQHCCPIHAQRAKSKDRLRCS